jgi:hypothetical protein
MSVLLSYAFHAVIRCGHCSQDLYAGWTSFVRCHVCEKIVDLQDLWKKFGIPEALQATLSTKEELIPIRDERSVLSSRKLLPYCQGCRSPIELVDFTEHAKSGWFSCPNCLAQISVRELSRADDTSSPKARWALHENSFKEEQAVPILFACLSCGQGIQVNGSARVVECASCHQKNFIPSTLWRYFQPAMQNKLFFVVYQFKYDPVFELRSVHPKPEVRCEAARMLVGAEALTEVFATERYESVIEVLAKNPDCPTSLLQSLSRGGSLTARRSIAASPNKLIFQEMPLDADPYRSAPIATNEDETWAFEQSNELAIPEGFSPQNPLIPLGVSPQKSLSEPPKDPLSRPQDNSWRQRFVDWFRKP